MSKIKKAYNSNKEMARLLIIMIVWLIFMLLTQSQKFFTGINFLTMAGQIPEYGLMVLGGMLVMMTGGIDLSLVGVANFASIICVLALNYTFGADGNMPIYFSIVVFLLAILIGTLVGILNAFLVAKLNVPPILATLGVNEFLTGLSIVITGGAAIAEYPKQFSNLFSINLFSFLPFKLVVFLIVALIIWLMLEKSTYGTKLRLYGTNPHVAKYSGVDTTKLLFKTYITSAICAAMGGLMMMVTYSSVRADYGLNYTMQAILIMVLGGVSPNGGKGKLSGVLVSIVLLKFIESGINRFRSVSTYYVTLIWGVVLILALIIDYFGSQPKKIRTTKSSTN